MESTEKKYPIVRQEWWESERGWGQRPDGYSLHRNAQDCKIFIKKTYDEVCASECGMRR